MAKRKKTITAGLLVKTILYTTPEPRDGDRARAEKSRMTTAAQKAMNDKTARGRLEMLLAANFTGRDLFLTLTYRPDDLPATRPQAVALVRRFLKQLRTYRRVRGQLLKYVYATEDKHGAAQLHHHIILTGTGEDYDLFRSLWPYGEVIDAEYIGERDYETWALYLTKESVQGRPVGAQMWTGSRNLIKPIIEVSFVPDDETLAAPAGCHVLEREERASEFGSYCYIKYRVLPKRHEKPLPGAGRRKTGAKGALAARYP